MRYVEVRVSFIDTDLDDDAIRQSSYHMSEQLLVQSILEPNLMVAAAAQKAWEDVAGAVRPRTRQTSRNRPLDDGPATG